MNMTLFERLEQNAARNDVAVLTMRKFIKEKQAELKSLPARFAIPKELGLGDTTTVATGMLNDVKRSLEKEIASLEAAVVICQRQSKYNKQHMYFRGQDELNPTNPNVPSLLGVDDTLAADATAAGLTVWEEPDADPEFSRDGDVDRTGPIQSLADAS
jgi:hypothetical protein